MRRLTLTWSAAVIAALLAGTAGAATAPASAPDGASTFAQNCSACHQLTGKGIPGAFPALAGDPFVQGPPQKVVVTLLNGRGGDLGVGQVVAKRRHAAAVSYVRSTWGNHAPPVDAGFGARLRGGGGPENAGAALQAH